MIETLMSVAFFAALCAAPGGPRGESVLDQSARAGALRHYSAVPVISGRQQSSPRDSFKNGAITGAIAGGLAGALLAAAGCSLDSGLGDSSDSSCLPGTVILVAMGAGIGAAIGVGVDALFERGPSPGMPLGGKRVGLRVRVAF